MKFSKELNSKTALIKAAYNFTDSAYVHLDADEQYYYVELEPKSGSDKIDEHDFVNEMLAQSVRHEIFQQTKHIRELLYARAVAMYDKRGSARPFSRRVGTLCRRGAFFAPAR